jgi:ferredoxin
MEKGHPMANKQEKNPGNVPGRWYVDSSCIDCDLCRETAPGIYDRNPEIGRSIVVRQPVTMEELIQAQEALEGCPTESIGNEVASLLE